MSNTINSSYNTLYSNVGKVGRTAPAAGKKDAKAEKEKDPFAQYGSSVEFSSEGLAALARQRTQALSETQDEAGAEKTSEEKLSPQAQAHLAKLREKYGDFDFVVAESIDDPESLTKNSTKEYSVILTRDELEKMAADEAHSDEVMNKVNSAVDMTKRIEEQLGDDVRFRHISIAFDDEGNMKIFAELEKLSEQQQERLKAAREKKAEEAEEAEKPDKEKEKEEEEDPFRRVKLEATTEEELMEKILGIDWDQVGAEKNALPEEQL